MNATVPIDEDLDGNSEKGKSDLTWVDNICCNCFHFRLLCVGHKHPTYFTLGISYALNICNIIGAKYIKPFEMST